VRPRSMVTSRSAHGDARHEGAKGDLSLSEHADVGMRELALAARVECHIMR
jgi:hypothetical protein